MRDRGLEIGVLADDLAGALASAARLRENGLRTTVLWSEIDVPATADAVVVDMRTRDRDGAPAHEARRWAAYLRAIGCRRFELRTDSTLRGSPAAELRGDAERSRPRRRGGPGGSGLSRRRARHDRRIAAACTDPAMVAGFPWRTGCSEPRSCRRSTSTASSRVVTRFTRPSASLRSGGVRCFVADATDDRHLSALAEAAGLVELDGDELVTVSPGAWLKYHPTLAIRRHRFVLVVVSSATDQNRRQLERVVATMPCRGGRSCACSLRPCPLARRHGHGSTSGRARDGHGAAGITHRLDVGRGGEVGRRRFWKPRAVPARDVPGW